MQAVGLKRSSPLHLVHPTGVTQNGSNEFDSGGGVALAEGGVKPPVPVGPPEIESCEDSQAQELVEASQGVEDALHRVIVDRADMECDGPEC